MPDGGSVSRIAYEVSLSKLEISDAKRPGRELTETGDMPANDELAYKNDLPPDNGAGILQPAGENAARAGYDPVGAASSLPAGITAAALPDVANAN
jgi:hypothetical protein